MNVKCPICSGEHKKVMTLLSTNLKVMGSSFPNTKSYIVSCDYCGTVYIDTDATQEDFNNYYNSGFSKTISYYEAFGEKITNDYFNNIYQGIKGYITPESQILDMGAGHGEFSKYLLDLGYKNILAIDPSEKNCEDIKNYGLNYIQNDSFINDDTLKEKFDLIIFSHALEHILDFQHSVENIKSMLKKDAIVYIELPDSKKYCNVNFPSFFFFTYEHLIHFTQETFVNFAKSYGLDLVQSNTFLKCESYYVINGIFKNNGKSEPIQYTDETINAILHYLEFSKDKLKPVIDRLEKSQEKLILWGIGASTAQLLNETFDKCNVVALIDSNPSRQSIEFTIGNKDLIVKDPISLTDLEATIVVLPIMYKNAIISQIQSMGFTNKIITLE
ncbi:class I SAM-dependent methyltransferase [Aliarcobacter cryaerophilus]|uniref:class I SAM-dependent methyltransferase n=1 Tax=Aliarcobacter cryaerophilus TaxID=28198 RepID=UPI0021B621B9|nr:class I SAM-dependent methyltransferase [Aliarcobacter cryaerophilus]MCT7489215.1 class I SAM-dependent methyltransferase [Aliarcobacter cryaerophilus]